MSRPKTLRRRRLRAMLRGRRRRFSTETWGRWEYPAESITWHLIPREKIPAA